MEEYYIEEERKLPVLARVDVLVCGGGPAGVGAAISAGRMGAKTMVVEAQDCLGGVATAGMMSDWGGKSSSYILGEIYARTAKIMQSLGYAPENEARDHAINHDAQKIVLADLMEEAGVKMLFYTHVCRAITENGRITGVIIENKSGRQVIFARCVIDSTGDGDVAASAGVPYFKGRESDGKMQPASLMFKVGGVDYSRAVFPAAFESKVYTDKGELQALAKEKLPFPAGHVLLYRQPTAGTVCCNMTNAIDIDGTSAEDLTRALISCRRQIKPIIEFLREYVPGYEHCWLMSVASLLGVRETRHFKAVKSLGSDDILSAARHDDWVVKRAWFNFDVHNMTGSGMDKTGVQEKFVQQGEYTIPYGCLLPVGVEGLLLSGRNIGGSHLAHSNFRIMTVCLATGEAAGIAAALYVKGNLASLKDVDVKMIQERAGK